MTLKYKDFLKVVIEDENLFSDGYVDYCTIDMKCMLSFGCTFKKLVEKFIESSNCEVTEIKVKNGKISIYSIMNLNRNMVYAMIQKSKIDYVDEYGRLGEELEIEI